MVSSSTGRTRWRRCSLSLITACSTIEPHPGQNRAVLLNLARQVGQESLILLFKCTMVTVPWSKSISLTEMPKASETRQPRRDSNLTRSLSLRHSAACSIRPTSLGSRYVFILLVLKTIDFFLLHSYCSTKSHTVKFQELAQLSSSTPPKTEMENRYKDSWQEHTNVLLLKSKVSQIM